MIRSFHSEDTDKLVALWLETSVSAHPFIPTILSLILPAVVPNIHAITTSIRAKIGAIKMIHPTEKITLNQYGKNGKGRGKKHTAINDSTNTARQIVICRVLTPE